MAPLLATHLSILVHLSLWIIRYGWWLKEVEETVSFHLGLIVDFGWSSLAFNGDCFGWMAEAFVWMKSIYLLGDCAHASLALVLLLLLHLQVHIQV